MTLVDSLFKVEDQVYLKTDIDQRARIVTGVLFRKNQVLYELACGAETTWHNDFEISKEKNIVIQTTN